MRRSDLRRAGYRRVRRGRGFGYLAPDGTTVRDATLVARFKSLVIPPAWTDVWICPWPTGHIQAVGTDAAGRRQYLYHEAFRAEQESAKHDHVLEMAARLPDARIRVSEDLARRGLVRERVLACATRLLDLGFFRIGSDQYAAQNGTYGLTTLLCEHVRCRADGTITFSYRAKGGLERNLTVVDREAEKAVAALIKRRRPDERLLAYWARPAWQEVHGEELNTYLKEIFDLDVSAKDFRTWHATVLAAVALAVSTRAGRASKSARKHADVRAVKEVAHYLGNTPAVCRASYINPHIFELFEEGRTVAATLGDLGEDGRFGRPATQGAVEQAVLDLLTGK